ncbi:putative histone acetyltransferase chromatin regulator PHD family [Helianthus annuus]|nr:putative histone acetyltransferase chromatin regulator PHD family [Helianthus annuus]KAJ0712545.1 putative histone acetyltransferase chromatin regulator PHD family [Helianthus annuus]
MNLHSHMSGQFSGQVPNQPGTSMSAVPHQQTIMQSSGGQRGTVNMEPGLIKARRYIQDRIYEFLMRRQQTQEIPQKKVMDIVRRLEEGLFKTATTKEEYMNIDTLESRLHILIKRLPLNNHNQQYQQQGNTSVRMGTMIPNPGMPQSASSSMDNMVLPAGNTGNLMPNGYQQSTTNFSNNAGGNTLISSMGAQRIASASQMIPTPGFSNNQSTSNQSYMNMDSSNSGVGLSTIDSTSVSQPLQQKPQVGGQNSRILHNLGSHMGGGIRSSIHQKANGFANGSLNSGVGIMGNNNLPIMNGLGTSESYVTASNYGSNTADSSRSGNFYVPTNSATSVMNNQNMNSISLHALHKTSPPLMVNQSNLVSTQQASNMKPLISQSTQHSLQQPLNFQQQHLQNQNQSQIQSQHKQQYHQNQHYSYGQSQLTPDPGGQSQVSDQFQSSHTINHFQENSMEDQFVDVKNGITSSIGVQPGSVTQGRWHSRSQEVPHVPGNNVSEQIVKQEFSQRITGQDQDQAQRNNLSSEGSITYQSAAKKSVEPPNSGAISKSVDPNRELQFKNQQRWLLFLTHARKCVHPPGKCPEVNCINAQNLLNHMTSCQDLECPIPRCLRTKRLLRHYRRCRDASCPVCVPVKQFVQLKGAPRADANDHHTTKMSPSVVETSQDVNPTSKRMKIEPSSESLAAESQNKTQTQTQTQNTAIPVPVPSASQFQDQTGDTNTTTTKSEVTGVKLEIPTSSLLASPKQDYVEDSENQKSKGASVVPDKATVLPKQELVKTEIDAGSGQGPPNPENLMVSTETISGTKSGKANIKGVSMIELFTPEQVREHISGLRQWVGQSKAKVEKNQALEHSMSENSCQLCAVEKLTFEPPPTYCTPCGARIKRNAMFYTVGTGDTRHYFCIPCYNDARGDTINVDGTNILKARLEKKKNDEETEEWWVQCDRCEAWQHQICALFNGRRNDGGQAEYTCPNCYVEEVERGERIPLAQSAVLGAKDLPRTILSDHIESRLFGKLKQERLERARVHGKSYDEVPGAESLVVRVVSSVDKKLEVKPRFLEIFQDENYPVEFGYKSKVVLLFQKIEGVEVCLFGMYVQEFGAECEQPNHRRVYLSYLDSVKYFRPEIRAVTGEALRTFVYHEILIGYLEYCKLRGFTSCYIWACPPLKGEDYILYCHPEIQKTPKSDKLREWYLSMLRKASKENIVVGLTNLYDHFFVSSGECKAKVTAARLPYFDGDYWPGAAEDMIFQIRQEEEGRKQNKKGFVKKSMTKRTLKACGQTDLSGNASKDLLLMRRLGDSISPMKEDFIMVHLQHACTHCCILMVSGNRWVCNQCKKFQICDKCYEVEQKLDDRERHPINHREKHPLYPIEINDVPVDTIDKDEILESEFFDTRQAFLSLCQGNHYQYDTLRRAKHSSMMVLYHLHNPTAPAFVTTCNRCHNDIETGQGWRCDVCPDFDVCNSCYHKDGGIDHPHKLTPHVSIAERDAQNKEARQQRVVQLRKMLDLLVHASQCRSPLCQYPNCRKVKGLFRHGINCKTRASGGCVLCKKMWYLLQLHARACKESQCHVPRCRDLKEHLRRLQQQAEGRRRAAVMEMMRQRAAEVAGGSG